MFSSFSKEYNEIWNKTKFNNNIKINKNNIIYSNELVKDLKILKRCNSIESIDYNINRINNEIDIRLSVNNKYSIENALYSMEGVGDVLKKIKDGVLFVIGKIISFFQFIGKKISEFFGKIFKKKTEQVKQEVEQADKISKELKGLPSGSTNINTYTPESKNDNSDIKEEEPQDQATTQSQTEKPKPTFTPQIVKIKKPQYDLNDRFNLPWPENYEFENAFVSDKIQDRIASFFNLDSSTLTKKIFNSSTTFEKLSKDDLTEDEMKQIYEENKENFAQVLIDRDHGAHNNKIMDKVKKMAYHGVNENSDDYKSLVNRVDNILISKYKHTSWEYLKIKPLEPPSNSKFYILLEKSKEIEKNIENDSNFVKIISKNLAKTYGVIRKLNAIESSDKIDKLSAIPRHEDNVRKLHQMKMDGEISNDDYKRNVQLIHNLDREKDFRKYFSLMCTNLIHFYQNLSKLSDKLIETKKQAFNSFLTVFSIYSKQLKFIHDVNLAKVKGKKVEII